MVLMKRRSLKLQETETCCGGGCTDFPDHTSELNRINRIQGQLEGIKRMIKERTYCPDIITQTSAAKSAITSLEAAILEKHLSACVREAFKTSSTDSEKKIKELLKIFKKSSK